MILNIYVCLTDSCLQYYYKYDHKFLLLTLSTPMFEWWGGSKRWETEPDHHQTLKAEEVYLFISKPWKSYKGQGSIQNDQNLWISKFVKEIHQSYYYSI